MALKTAPSPKPLRIDRISIRSYGAFSAREEIEVGGKNLIIYGENGAGKSSLYRALRDLFARKPSANALKKGQHQPKNDDAPPEVVITFNDQKPGVTWTKAQHPGRVPAEPRLAAAALRASFLDYHALLKTNALHGQARPNFFKVVVEDLLPDFREATSSATLEERWRSVRPPFKHRYDGSHLPPVEQACATFNEALQTATDALLARANELLVDLDHGDMELLPWERGSVRYNKAHVKKQRGFDGQELFPSLRFRGQHELDAPQTFLNEARLSALALALYLGGRLASVPSGAYFGLKLLVLDDVLVGLDYGNRRPLLQLLERRFPDWQIVLLTHDRYWFEIVRAQIPRNRWSCYEMYKATAADASVAPLLRKLDTSAVVAAIVQAKRFVAEKHLPAAANYARSGCELLLRDFCEREKVPFPYLSEPRRITFEKLKDGLRAKVDQTKKAALDAIGPHQSRVLNPLSHDPTIALNEAEIVAAIAAVEALKVALEA